MNYFERSCEFLNDNKIHFPWFFMQWNWFYCFNYKLKYISDQINTNKILTSDSCMWYFSIYKLIYMYMEIIEIIFWNHRFEDRIESIHIHINDILLLNCTRETKSQDEYRSDIKFIYKSYKTQFLQKYYIVCNYDRQSMSVC